MLKAKTRMIERDSEAFTSEVFAVADNITPIAIASVDSILKLEDTEDLQVVPEQKVKQLIVENKSTNPMSKFYVRLGTYLDSMENFLTEMHSNYMKAVEQKRSLHGLEDSDQKRKTARAKRTARKLAVNKFLNSFKFSGKQDLYDMPLGLMVMNFLRGGFEDRIADQAESIVIVPYKPVAGQLKAKGETEDEFVSGYKLTSAYGHRWGRMHGGVDIGVPIGTMFALKKKSVIKFVGYQDPDDPSVGYGLLVDAWVPSLGKMFRFGHLSEVSVEKGDNVAAGQVMGKSGNAPLRTQAGVYCNVRPYGPITAVRCMPCLPYSQNKPKFNIDPKTGHIHSEMNSPGIQMAYANRLFLKMVHETGAIGRVAMKPTQAMEDGINAGLHAWLIQGTKFEVGRKYAVNPFEEHRENIEKIIEL